MSHCSWQNEVAQTVREGRWPSGCTDDLRNHVSACTGCTEEVRVLSTFATARAATMRMATPHGAELLWWKAQLRKRNQAMERMQRPGLAISTATVAASIVVLIAVLATVWKQIQWTTLLTTFATAGWNTWMIVALAAALCGFITAALVIGLEYSDEHR